MPGAGAGNRSVGAWTRSAGARDRSDSGGTRSGAWTRSDSGGRAAIGEIGSPSRSLGDGSHQPDQSGSSPGAQPRSGPAGCWSA